MEVELRFLKDHPVILSTYFLGLGIGLVITSVLPTRDKKIPEYLFNQ